jgi:Mrp family chromosome partitioning ATPase
LRGQLAEQSSTLLGNHPRIKELKAQIADLEGQTRREAEKLVRAFENEARIAGARVETLSASLDQLKRQASVSGEQDVVLRSLEREAKAQRDLLESYLAKYREANARDSLSIAPAEARIISTAIVSNTPSFPKKVPIVLIATLATLFLSVGFITTGELLSGNVYRATDFAEEPMAPAEPVMAAPPLPSERVRAVMAHDRQSHVAPDPVAPEPQLDAPDLLPPESTVPVAPPPAASADQLANGLRRAGEAGRRITVVGAVPNIGTTSTAIGLARILAEEARVVLIDLALNAPNIAAISSDPGAPGIAELMRGTASFRHIITRDRSSRLHLIAAGRVPADAGAILRSDRLTIAMNALARTYDHVVIDAGALAQIPLERFARLAPHAVLVAPGLADDATKAAHERLIAAGFTDVTMFTDPPPRPDAAIGPNTRAA